MYLLIQCLFTLATDYKWETDVVSVKLMSTSAQTLCILQQSNMYFTTIGLLNKSMCLINVYLYPYSYVFYNNRNYQTSRCTLFC